MRPCEHENSRRGFRPSFSRRRWLPARQHAANEVGHILLTLKNLFDSVVTSVLSLLSPNSLFMCFICAFFAKVLPGGGTQPHQISSASVPNTQ